MTQETKIKSFRDLRVWRVGMKLVEQRFTQGLKEKLESFEFRVPSPNPQPLAPSTQPLGKRELRAVSAGHTYAVQVQSLGHAWTLDEPTADGGTDTGPDPVPAFLGALLSCMTISFKAAARRRQITIERMEGRVQANSPGHVKNITMSLVVWSPDPEEKVRALLDTAKRGCYVSGVLKPEIEIEVELAVMPF